MEIPLLSDIVLILGLAVIVILIFQRFKVPTIIGYIITGIIAGPYGLSLVTASHEVEILAEIGVILLLFTIGIEFSLKSLAAIKKSVFIGGSLQVGLTILVVGLLSWQFGFSPGEAVFLGFLISLSSTAIVLKLLQEKGEINSPHGKAILAILIFQDIIVVPMMLFTPLIAGNTEDPWLSLLYLALNVLLVVVVVYVSARWLVPKLLHRVAQTKSKELFILSIVVICFAVAWFTSSIGLSLALGAFLAGLIISESEYSHQATSNILPFHEIFTSFFFVSIGMLMDVTFLWKNLAVVLLFVVAIIIVKALIAFAAAFFLKYPYRTALLVGISIFQVGEFAFILSITGLQNELLTPQVYQYFLSISILTMAITPFVIKFSHPITRFLLKAPIPENIKLRYDMIQKAKLDEQTEVLNDHLVIIGYGINGKNVANAAKKANISYIIIELNADTVKEEKRKGEPIVFGDAIHGHILSHVNIHQARVAVIAISDPVATKQVIVNIRQISTKIHVIVRTRFVMEMDDNYRLGADEVIPEEFETSIEIFTRVLHKYLVPLNEIEDFTRAIRADNYEMLRSAAFGKNDIRNLSVELPEIDIAALHVQKDKNEIIGKRLLESNIRRTYGINIVGIRRGQDYLYEILPETEIHQEDVLYVIGKSENIFAFNERIKI